MYTSVYASYVESEYTNVIGPPSKYTNVIGPPSKYTNVIGRRVTRGLRVSPRLLGLIPDAASLAPAAAAALIFLLVVVVRRFLRLLGSLLLRGHGVALRLFLRVGQLRLVLVPGPAAYSTPHSRHIHAPLTRVVSYRSTAG